MRAKALGRSSASTPSIRSRWATKALDEVRRRQVNELRAEGTADTAAGLKGTRWAMLKNPGDLTMLQRTGLAAIAKLNSPLYRAYLLKEQLRAVLPPKATTDGSSSPAGWPGRNGPASSRS